MVALARLRYSAFVVRAWPGQSLHCRLKSSAARALLKCLIMPGAKPVTSPPMHSFRFRWERACNAQITTARPLSHLLGPKD
jgi:hypothetical protein